MSTKTQRLWNLVIVLVNARQPITRAEIFERVQEYGADTALETKVRMFERDKKELREHYGEMLQTRKLASDEDADGYIIDRESFMLASVDLTPEDRALITLAGTVWGNAQLAGPGHEAGFLLGRGHADDDVAAVAGRSGLVGVVYEAITSGRVVSFTYASKRGKDVAERVVEPWRVFCHGGAWYMVGFDRNAVAEDGTAGARRIFRLSRILSDIAVTDEPSTHAAPVDIDEHALVEGWLALPSASKTAVLTVHAGTCGHLRLLADDIVEGDGTDTLTITYDVEDRLARSIAAVCDVVSVVAPPELRDAVDDIVRKAVGDE